MFVVFTFEPAVEVRVGGHLEAGVRQQEAADVGEAGVDVFPDVLQLLVLVLLHLNTRQHCQLSDAEGDTDYSRTAETHLQSFLQEAQSSLQTVRMLVGVTPVSDQEHQSLNAGTHSGY